MDCASGRRRWKDCSLRKASRERLYPIFSKRGASGRHNKLVRKIPDAVSIPKEVKGRSRTGSAGRSGRGALPGNEMSILDLKFLAAISLAPLGLLLLFWSMFPDDRGIHPIYRDSGLNDTEKDKNITS